MKIYSTRASDLNISGQTTGDIIYFDGTHWVRLPVGTANQILQVIGGIPSWQTKAIPLSGLQNSGGVTGDIIYWDGTNWVRLPIGTENQILQVISGIPTWKNQPLLFPDVKKWGVFQPVLGTGGLTDLNGLFASPSQFGVWSNGTRDSTGKWRRFSTGTVIGNQAGIVSSIADLFRRSENCRIKIKIRLVSTTNQRFFGGFSSSTGVFNSDDPLNATSGIGLCKITTSANWQIARNDGVGATVFIDTGIVADTTIITVEFRIRSDGLAFQYSINNGNFVDVTTDIPSSTTNLGYVILITTNEAVAKNFEANYFLCENDK